MDNKDNKNISSSSQVDTNASFSAVTPEEEPTVPLAASRAEPVFKESPLASRRSESRVSRRAFATGLIGLTAVGAVGGGYILSQKLARPTLPTLTANTAPPATPISINNRDALIFAGHLASVNALVWSLDGRMIASAGDDMSVQIFEVSSGKRSVIYTGHTGGVEAVAWSPNGKYIVSGSQDRTAQVWEATTGRKIFSYGGHSDQVNAVSWSNESRYVASGSDDKTVRVWNAFDGALSFNFRGHTGGVLCVGWQPYNSSVASGSWDGTVRDWATVVRGYAFQAGEQIFNYGGHGQLEVYALSWSPDGSFIASAGADQTVQISNGYNGSSRPPFFMGHQNKQSNNLVRAVDWSPQGDYIVSGDTDGNILVWRVEGRKTVFTYQGHKGAVNAVAWSPDGKRVASASADKTVHIWSFE
ncbi:MAG TPA: WD40 repeat domain-containing protein [Ktedonobacteraceae bacterium]|nr:WD40 repeat domain-containing protein [Ktedonobacteraceae bacterium]